MAEIITYETLREIQRAEKKSQKLYSIDSVFYKQVKDYLERKVPDDDLTRDEMRNAKLIFEDIIDRRESKIMKQALTTIRMGERVDTTVMTSFEKDFFKKLVDMLKEYREQILNKKIDDIKQEESEEAEDTPEEEIEYVKVKILETLPEIVGADMEDYGPFKRGDTVELPLENATLFIDGKKAKKVRKQKS